MRNHYKERVPIDLSMKIQSIVNRALVTELLTTVSRKTGPVWVHRQQIFLFFIVYLLPTLCSFQASFIIHRHGTKKKLQSNNTQHSSTMSYNLYRNRTSKVYIGTRSEQKFYQIFWVALLEITAERYSLCDSILFATCWCPTYFIDISSPYISKWFFEHVIVTWLTYTARVLIMFYFAFAPFGVRVD